MEPDEKSESPWFQGKPLSFLLKGMIWSLCNHDILEK